MGAANLGRGEVARAAHGCENFIKADSPRLGAGDRGNKAIYCGLPSTAPYDMLGV